MKYTVTFCLFDHTVGANPFWHSSLLLSKLDEKTQRLEVVDTWGFYGGTSTGDKNTCIEKLKNKLALDVDFQGNHGMLKHEEIRYMDRGHGLHGYTFEVTQDQFMALQERCAKTVADQDAAIKEVVGTQNLKIEGKKPRSYPEEAYSRQIFEMEQMKAKAEQRESRLKPFDFHVSMSLWGPNLNKSNTCKTRAVALLDGILTKEQLAPFKSTAIPRWIKGLEPIYLHSTGETLHKHTKKNGEEVFFRDLDDHDVKLFWSVPPQHFDALSANTKKLFTIDAVHQQEVKSLVSKLQHLEWLLESAIVPQRYKRYKADLIQRIVTCYQDFAIIEPKNDSKIAGLRGFALSLFSLPRSSDEKKLQDNIEQAKVLLNCLYMAIVDDWVIDDDYSFEPVQIDDEEKEDIEDYNSLEAIVAYLSEKDKKKICQIIGRNYMGGEPLPESRRAVGASM